MKNLSTLCISGLLMAGALQASAQTVFPPVDTNFATKTVIVPQTPFNYKVIFREGESMVVNKDGQSSLARGAHDFLSYIPIGGSSEHGYLISNHELRDSSTAFGDGGGMTVFEIRKQNDDWSVVSPYRSVDFSTVGGTYNNCGGALTPFGNVITAEEFGPNSNAEAYSNGRQIRDTSDVTISYDGQSRTIKRWQNLGWLVEVDPANARAVRKLWKMGRMSHEGAWCMADGKTVYVTDDNDPAVFFKFVAKNANDYTDGQLYAYKQSADGNSGSWLELPMEFDSLLVIRDVAIRRGATLFIRHEWPTEANGKIYLTETGRDAFNWKKAIDMGGVPAIHMQQQFATSDSTFVDFYGRIVEFDPATNRFRVYINGGAGQKDRTIHLSNPDGLTTIDHKGKKYFVIQEDLNGETMGRVGLDAQKAKRIICEAYWLDASIQNPTTDDLIRFIVGPAGSELTGGVPTPDGKTFFVNIQHPSSSNPAPFNKSATVAITGLDKLSTVKDPTFEEGSSTFQIYPNPATRVLHFNRSTDVAIYDVTGRRVMTERKADRVDISTLTPGIYFVQSIEGDVQRLVVQ